MKFVEVPAGSLSTEALRGLVEEFITREGTDYGEREHSLEDKVRAVLAQLKKGSVAIVFDPESESCNLITRDALASLSAK